MFLLQKSTTTALLVLIVVTFVIFGSVHCQPTYFAHICSGQANESSSTNFTSNLGSFLDSLASMASVNSFYNGTSTTGTIYGLYLCRGDVSSSLCQSCVGNATERIKQSCSLNTTAVVWYDECLLRYSDNNFFGAPNININEVFMMYNVANTSNSGDQTNYPGIELIYTLLDYVPNTNLLFGTNDFPSGNGSQRNYALAQCTRDLSSSGCSSCLRQLRSKISQCCEAKVGWRILAPSCFMRYEQFKFYQTPSIPPTSPTQSSVPSNGKKSGNSGTVIAIVVASVLVVGAAFGFGFWKCYYKKRRHTGIGRSQDILLRGPGGSPHYQMTEHGMQLIDQDTGGEMHYFNLATICAATNNFSAENKLGQGGFGPVYKGKLSNGEEIAVKRLSIESKQGLEEFRNEVMVIVKLQHKNLVRLLGYCLEGDETLLIYEYLANTSLDAFLFDPDRSKRLDWPTRANIIKGTARGLQYLHEDSRLKIIHRDMKASNVLLDDEMNPKISDFGTAKIFGGNQIEANTNRVVGTFGYMAPEYALEGVISTKSDVYSFGVLMLEIISGKKNRGFYNPDQHESLLLHAWHLWDECRGEELIDPNIVETCLVNEALRWIHIALLCIHDDPVERPTMSQVVLMLGSDSTALPRLATGPRFYARFDDLSSTTSRTGTGTRTGAETESLTSECSTNSARM